MKNNFIIFSDYTIGMLSGYWVASIILSEQFKIRFQNHFWLELLVTIILTLVTSIPATKYLESRKLNQEKEEKEEE